MKLRYTLPALADPSGILDYIAAVSPRGARRVQARIQALTDLLLLHPHIGRRTNDTTIRRMTTTPYPYLVLYEATETEIIIHAVQREALTIGRGRRPHAHAPDQGPARGAAHYCIEQTSIVIRN